MSILLSNGRRLQHIVASGALGPDGGGYLWDWPAIALGRLKRHLFAIILKSVTEDECAGNFRWWKFWESVQLIPGGAVNKYGLRNKGAPYHYRYVWPNLDYQNQAFIASIVGDEDQMVRMAATLNAFNFTAIELNYSCPNTGAMAPPWKIINAVLAVKRVSRHPVIVKLSVAQAYLVIAPAIADYAEAIDLNSVPHELAFPGKQSPLHKLEKRVGKGGGGVSGKPAQELNWKAVKELADQGALPVIGPSAKEYEDLGRLQDLGASAFSYGVAHLPDYPLWRYPWTLFTAPCRPTQWAERWEREMAV